MPLPPARVIVVVCVSVTACLHGANCANAACVSISSPPRFECVLSVSCAVLSHIPRQHPPTSYSNSINVSCYEEQLVQLQLCGICTHTHTHTHTHTQRLLYCTCACTRDWLLVSAHCCPLYILLGCTVHFWGRWMRDGDERWG